MRLIDADALIEFCAERWIPLNIDAVNMQPTIEPSTNCSEFPNNSDTISRQAAIDALTEHRALYCDNTPETFSKLSYVEKSRVDELDTAIATLVNLPPAQPEPQWIPCSERMPEEHEWIGTKKIGTTISDEVYVTFENEKGERFCKHMKFQNGKLGSYDQFHMDTWFKGSKPIAWMPLPEAYKGDEK